MPKAVLSVDFDSARRELVEDQIMRRGIRDRAVLQALLQVPRHLFVGPGFLSRAYSDSALPIKENQTISQPYIVALMTQSAMLNADDSVLEIGTASAYQAAVLIAPGHLNARYNLGNIHLRRREIGQAISAYR